MNTALSNLLAKEKEQKEQLKAVCPCPPPHSSMGAYMEEIFDFEEDRVATAGRGLGVSQKPEIPQLGEAIISTGDLHIHMDTESTLNFSGVCIDVILDPDSHQNIFRILAPKGFAGLPHEISLVRRIQRERLRHMSMNELSDLFAADLLQAVHKHTKSIILQELMDAECLKGFV